MHKIIHEREKCIGCGACTVICPDFWEMNEERIAVLKEGKEIEGHFEREVDEASCNEDAAQGCPVQCIHIKKN